MTGVFELLNTFISRAHRGEDQATKHYPKTFRGLTSEVSFGKGTRADVAGLSFYKDEAEAQPGHFTGFYYDWRNSLLFLVLGVSETADLVTNWPPELLARYPDFASLDDSAIVAAH